MLSKALFLTAIKSLPNKIPSKTGIASYTGFNIDVKTLHFTRVNTKRKWKLDLDLLYEIYRTNNFINTTVVKAIGKGRVNSPSVAILMAIGCIDDTGNRIKKDYSIRIRTGLRFLQRSFCNTQLQREIVCNFQYCENDHFQ